MDLPPDQPGLYKWLIVLSSFMIQYLVYAVTYSIGVFYVMFKQNIGGTSSIMSFASSLNSAMCFSIGPLAGALTNHYGCRPVAVVGSMIGSMGLILTAFITEPWHLLITFGIITGLGMGLCYIPAISITGFYFGKRRSLAIGITVMGPGAGPITFPPLLRFLEDHFGWRGAMLIVGGSFMQTIIFSALLRRPVKNMNIKVNCKTTQSGDWSINESKQVTAITEQKSSALSSCLNHYKPIFTNLPLMIYYLQNVMFSFGLCVITVHIGAYAISLGHGKDRAAMLFLSLGVASAVARLLYIGLVRVLKPSILYTFVTCFCGVFTIIYPFGPNYVALVAITSIIGLFHASYGSLQPLVTIDIVGIKLFPDAYGCHGVSSGIGFLAGAPIAGWLYDTTHYYPASFFLGGAFMLLSSVVMVTVEIIYRRLVKHESTKSSNIDELKRSTEIEPLPIS